MEKVASPVKFTSTSFLSARFSYQQVTGFNQELQDDGTVTVTNGWVMVSLWGGEVGAMITLSGTQAGTLQLVYVPRFCDKIVPPKYFLGSRSEEKWLDTMVEDVVRDLLGACREEDRENLQTLMKSVIWK